MTVCGRCQAELRDGYSYPPGLDVDRRRVIVDGEVRKLGMIHVDLLGVLWTRRGRYVHRETLIRFGWGQRELSSPRTNLREAICQIRKRTKGMPFEIHTDKFLGYMLEERTPR